MVYHSDCTVIRRERRHSQISFVTAFSNDRGTYRVKTRSRVVNKVDPVVYLIFRSLTAADTQTAVSG
jgi:hypothetical protein